MYNYIVIHKLDHAYMKTGTRAKQLSFINMLGVRNVSLFIKSQHTYAIICWATKVC